MAAPHSVGKTNNNSHNSCQCWLMEMNVRTCKLLERPPTPSLRPPVERQGGVAHEAPHAQLALHPPACVGQALRIGPLALEQGRGAGTVGLQDPE